jgi:hypothetical protein
MNHPSIPETNSDVTSETHGILAVGRIVEKYPLRDLTSGVALGAAKARPNRCLGPENKPKHQESAVR